MRGRDTENWKLLPWRIRKIQAGIYRMPKYSAKAKAFLSLDFGSGSQRFWEIIRAKDLVLKIPLKKRLYPVCHRPNMKIQLWSIPGYKWVPLSNSMSRKRQQRGASQGQISTVLCPPLHIELIRLKNSIIQITYD